MLQGDGKGVELQARRRPISRKNRNHSVLRWHRVCRVEQFDPCLHSAGVALDSGDSQPRVSPRHRRCPPEDDPSGATGRARPVAPESGKDPESGATPTAAFFVIHPRRTTEGLKALLGEKPDGIARGDRWGSMASRRRDGDRSAGRAWSAVFRSRSIEEDPLKRSAERAWMGSNARSPTGGCPATASSTVRACKRGRIGSRANSKAYRSRVARAGIPRRRPFAATPRRCLRRCGRSRKWRGSSPPPTMRSGCRVVQTPGSRKRPARDCLYRAIMARRAGLPAPQPLGQGGN